MFQFFQQPDSFHICFKLCLRTASTKVIVRNMEVMRFLFLHLFILQIW